MLRVVLFSVVLGSPAASSQPAWVAVQRLNNFICILFGMWQHQEESRMDGQLAARLKTACDLGFSAGARHPCRSCSKRSNHITSTLQNVSCPKLPRICSIEPPAFGQIMFRPTTMEALDKVRDAQIASGSCDLACCSRRPLASAADQPVPCLLLLMFPDTPVPAGPASAGGRDTEPQSAVQPAAGQAGTAAGARQWLY